MTENESRVNPLLKDTTVSPNFYRDYANNVFLEPSAWDMKLVFGTLEQRPVPMQVEQHGSVTLPWNQTKIFAYLLCVHLTAHEMANGPIYVQPSVIPPMPTPPTDEAKKADPNTQAFYERMLWLREQFFGNSTKS